MTQSTRESTSRPAPVAAAVIGIIFVLLTAFLLLVAVKASPEGFGTAPYVLPTQYILPPPGAAQPTAAPGQATAVPPQPTAQK